MEEATPGTWLRPIAPMEPQELRSPSVPMAPAPQLHLGKLFDVSEVNYEIYPSPQIRVLKYYKC